MILDRSLSLPNAHQFGCDRSTHDEPNDFGQGRYRWPMINRLHIPHNITLFGKPGSGKGFYGRRFAEAWNIPLYSASSILKMSNKLPSEVLNSGKLLDCEIVSNTLCAYLTQHHDSSKRFLIDGFPRTHKQLTLMDSQWPDALKVPIALHLNIPDKVCADKIVGRKICSVCQQEPNVADVKFESFDLPPTRPPSCENRCDPDVHWKKRPDDESEHVVLKRIANHRIHEEELIKSYSEPGRQVFSVTPYRGAKDFHSMREHLENKLAKSSLA